MPVDFDIQLLIEQPDQVVHPLNALRVAQSVVFQNTADGLQGLDVEGQDKAGDIVQDEGQLYRSIHDVKDAGQNRKPSETPSNWTRIGNPLEEFPEWVRPIGAHDAYSKDAKTSHSGKKWVSEVDGNVWEPGVYGWAEYSEPEPQEAPQEARDGASEEPGE